MPILIPAGTDTTVTWVEWAETIQMHLPECPLFVISDALRDAAIEFYRSTRCWRARNVTVATLVADQADYTVTPPADTFLVGLPAVWLDGEEIAEMLPGEIDDYYTTDTGTVERVGIKSFTSVSVSPTPDSSGGVITATVAYAPSLPSTTIHLDRYTEHRSAIEAMTFDVLMRQPGKPWTQPALAERYRTDAASLCLLYSTEKGPKRRTPLRVKIW